MTSSAILPESAVLKPPDPTITNTDEWPEFTLSDAIVTLPDSCLQEPVSLLVASEHYPLKITGRLESVPKHLAHLYLLSNKQRTATIEVGEVRSYAYGVYADGSVELWAAGKAGWFVVRPSRTYRPVYNEMIQAVNVLFFIVDTYATPRINRKGKKETVLPDYNAQELFDKYAAEVLKSKDGTTEATARDIIYRHRDFLISSMITGKEGVAWGKKPLYRHLCQKFPKDVARVRQRLIGQAAPALSQDLPERQKAQHARQISRDSSSVASTSSSVKRKRGRPPKNPPAGLSTDVISIESSSSSESVVAEAPQTEAPVVVCHAETKALPKQRQESARAKGRKPKQSAREPSPEIDESQVTTPAQDSDSDSRPRRAGKGKSALRLKPSKATKGPGVPREPPDEDEDELSIEHTHTRNGKRKRGPDHPPSRKRRSSKHNVDEGIDIPTSPSDSHENEDTIAGATPEESSELAASLDHKPDQLQQDVWLCALDGCTHKVYRASAPESQKLIREHYALHAYDDDERVRLVKQISQETGMHGLKAVGHLMERVRIQARVEGFPGSKVAGTRFPVAVRQKF